MFIDIWDKENSAIKINKYGESPYRYLSATNSKIEFSSTESGFNEIINFITSDDCILFLKSGAFTYLFESEDIDFIKITSGKTVLFKYDNRRT